jgi:15-cis-phytoene desaturase
MTSPKETNIAVLGAGVAGLTAAHELAERGFNVTVYSPQNVLGGMARSQRFVPKRDEVRHVQPTRAAKRPAIGTHGDADGHGHGDGDGTVPGEHGFHFFPPFYKHVFDTMARIDYLDETHHATGRTVDQNLVPTAQQGVADGKETFTYEPASSSRREIRKELDQLLRTPGVTGRDLARFTAKIIEYMTSCSERRASCERISAWDYLEADCFSPAFGSLIDRVPQLLVSMRAKECDARTYGNIVTQIALDQIKTGNKTDRTLNAPTSDAWFRPWQKYLESCGVVFKDGTLTGIGPKGELSVKTPGASTKVQCDYAVIAVPIEEARALVTSSLAERSPTLHAIYNLPITDALRWMSGIQYYFLEEVAGTIHGHIIYTGAPWGLSSISQSQFWRTVGDGGAYWTPRGLVRGIISVDIANWNVPVDDEESPIDGKTARECTKDEIAQEIWRQMKADLAKSSFRVVRGGARKGANLDAEWSFYHLDDDLLFADPAGTPTGVVSQILINRPGAWRARPGRAGSYALSLEKIAFAGTYMQTFTRLTTMEAANESARHAVNAVLDAAGYRGDRCPTWDMEKSEEESLSELVELDAVLYAHGQPHWMRTARIVETLDTLLPRNPNGTEGTDDFARGDVREIARAFELALQSANIPTATSVTRYLCDLLGPLPPDR